MTTFHTSLIYLLALLPLAAAEPSKPLSKDVITAMKQVHADFTGQEGYIAQFGDSITYSMAFWPPMSWDRPEKYLSTDDGLPKLPTKDQRWSEYMKGARDKGTKFANYSGWTIDQVLAASDDALNHNRPMAVIIMIGTNDISGNKTPADYPNKLEQLIKKCLAAKCVPILNTIPPRRDHAEAVSAINDHIRAIATHHQIPMVDFHAACLAAQPDGAWDGTLISKDGVHPSGGKTNVYTPENLKTSGYALRNWLNFLVIRQLATEVFTR